MCANWGYGKLVEYLEKRAADEQAHALELIDRILYLEGTPLFSEMATVFVGNEVVDMFPIDKDAELIAIAGYCEAIQIAIENADFGTRKLLEHILEEEEQHLNDIESNMTQITNSGIADYLVIQIGG
jgi:bacterioferritin